MKKLTKIVAGSALACCIALPSWAQEKVMIGEPAWPSARVIAQVIKTVIENEIGGEADVVPGKNPVIFQAMDRGKGDIDVHPDVWLPNQGSLTAQYVDENGTVALSENTYPGTNGMCVPAYMAEKGIRTIQDLATPDGAAMFDSDGDGRGEIWIGAAAWAGAKTWQVKLRDYGIAEFFEATTEDEAVALANVGNKIRAGEGVAFACYKPHYAFKLYDLVILEEPAYDPEMHKMVQPNEDPDWFDNSTVSTGDKPKTVHVAYSKSLETRAPEVAQFLANIALDDQTVSEWTHQVVVGEQAPEDVAAAWVAANSDRVQSWLGY
ncbi:glycine betaine ABC transporter substrate-binding protein [Roseovarius sp. 2305UL8-3]|uniref:ABC transporter substrate-binding protein n=1 Tax=Roseovarius conchicola TaxID=3121636 RepID=UPI0035293529